MATPKNELSLLGNREDVSDDVLVLIEKEGLSLSEAAKLIPSRKAGKRVDLNTIWRWCQKGVKGGLRLRSVLISGTRYTTRTWLRDFIQARNHPVQSHGTASQPPRTQQQRLTSSEQAARELERRWKSSAR